MTTLSEIIQQLKNLPIEERAYIIATWRNQNDDSPAEKFRTKHSFDEFYDNQEGNNEEEDATITASFIPPLDAELTKLVFDNEDTNHNDANQTNNMLKPQDIRDTDPDWLALQLIITELEACYADEETLPTQKAALSDKIIDQYKSQLQALDRTKLKQLALKTKQTYYYGVNDEKRWEGSSKSIYDLIQDSVQSKNWMTINNPGGGDCAYYSLAVGLIPYLTTDREKAKDLLWRLESYYDAMQKENNPFPNSTGKEFFSKENICKINNFQWESTIASTGWIQTFMQLMRYILVANAKISIQQLLKEPYSSKMLERLEEISMLQTAVDAFYKKANNIVVVGDHEETTLTEDYERLGINKDNVKEQYVEWAKKFPRLHAPEDIKTIALRKSLHHLYITALFLLPKGSWTLVEQTIARTKSDNIDDTLIINALWAMLTKNIALNNPDIIINNFLEMHQNPPANNPKISRFANGLYFPSLLQQLSCSHQNIRPYESLGTWVSMVGGTQRIVNTLDQGGHFQTRFYLPSDTEAKTLESTSPTEMNSKLLHSIDDKGDLKELNENDEQFHLQQSFYAACQTYVESDKTDNDWNQCKQKLDNAYATLWQYYASGEYAQRYKGAEFTQTDDGINKNFRNWAWDLLVPLNEFLSVSPNEDNLKCQEKINDYMRLLGQDKTKIFWNKVRRSVILAAVDIKKLPLKRMFLLVQEILSTQTAEKIKANFNCTMRMVKTDVATNANSALSLITNGEPTKKLDDLNEGKWEIKVRHKKVKSPDNSEHSIDNIQSLNDAKNNTVEKEETLIEIQSSKRVSLVQGWNKILSGNDVSNDPACSNPTPSQPDYQQMAAMLIETYIATSSASKDNPKTIRVTGQDKKLQDEVRKLIGKNSEDKDNMYPFLTEAPSMAQRFRFNSKTLHNEPDLSSTPSSHTSLRRSSFTT